MNYWAAETLNLAECHEPMLRRLAHGGHRGGWPASWAICLFARLQEHVLYGQITRSAYNRLGANLLTGRTFQIDCISGQGTHMLDYAMSLNEDARVLRVFGAASGTEGMQGVHPAPDTTVGQVLFSNGVYGAWNNGWTAPRVGDESTTWQHCRVAAYAERGHTLWEEFGRWEIVSPDGTEGGENADGENWVAGNHAAQAALTDAMFDWIEDDDKPAGTCLALGLHKWEAVLALYASALWRRPVELPFEPPEDLFVQLAQALSQ